MKVLKLSNLYLSFQTTLSWEIGSENRRPSAEMDSVVPTPGRLRSNFLALLGSVRLQRGYFPVLLSPPGALHFSSQGYFYPPQLSAGVSGVWGTHRKGDLQGDFG